MIGSRAIGLTSAEVAQRVADGRINDVPSRATRSVADIVRANVFTRINAILAVLFAIVLATGSLVNGLFGLLIILNSVIGVIQELRAKLTLDRLSIVGQVKPLVRRADGTRELSPSEVVSTTSSSSAPVIRSWSTAWCSRSPGSRSTSRY